MTDGIGRIFGGNSYGIGGYAAPRNNGEETNAAKEQTPAYNYEETQVDPSKVMAFLESNNIFVRPQVNVTAPAELNQETQDRIAGYMEQFEMIYGIIAKEFGEELAPTVMDFVMDSLMGMAA